MKRGITLVALLAIAVAVVSAQSGPDLLQQALELERGKGEIDAAIQLYQRILREFSTDKPIAARALLQLAHVQELRGQDQARKSYELLLQDYGDQTDIAAQARSRLSALNPRKPTIYIAKMDPTTGLAQSVEMAFTPREDTIDRYPTWSPDGQFLAFVRTAAQAQGPSAPTVSIVVRSRQSQSERTYERKGAGAAIWLHDNSGFLSFALQNTAIVYRTTLEGSSRELGRLNVPADDVSISPDGKNVYALVPLAVEGADFVNTTIVVFDALTGQRLGGASLPLGVPSKRHSFLKVSPDGSSLAIVRPGKDEAQIARCGTNGAAGYRVLAVQPGLTQGVTWTADNRFILYAASDSGAKWRIMRVSADGGSPTFTGLEVTDLTYFDLSPDGQHIAFDGTGYAIRKNL